MGKRKFMIGNERGMYLREWLMHAKFAGTEKAKQDNLVALSFDDGPHPENTPEVLAILKENRAHATFFWIVSNALILLNYNPSLFKKIVKEIKNNGHEIGLHAPNDVKPSLSSRFFGPHTKYELGKAKETLENITGIKVIYYRPHYIQLGSSIKHATNLGMTTVLGDVFNSVNPYGSVSDQIGKIKRATGGSILILHDGQSNTVKKNNTIFALPQVILTLIRRGLIPTSVSRVLEN